MRRGREEIGGIISAYKQLSVCLSADSATFALRTLGDLSLPRLLSIFSQKGECGAMRLPSASL